jgi:hypothetical protein
VTKWFGDGISLSDIPSTIPKVKNQHKDLSKCWLLCRCKPQISLVLLFIWCYYAINNSIDCVECTN